jgi:FKBP12-rapamycin complex-associated protein
MLVKAMEVSGIEGNFRSTCCAVMHVLRSNKDSVMAMLEAFVHDPLINWRLLNTATDQPTQRATTATADTTPPARQVPQGSVSCDSRERRYISHDSCHLAVCFPDRSCA